MNEDDDDSGNDSNWNDSADEINKDETVDEIAKKIKEKEQEKEQEQKPKRTPIVLNWNREAVNQYDIKPIDKKEILDAVRYIIDNRDKNIPIINIVSYVNVIMKKARLHLQLKLNDDGSLDFV